MPLDGTEGQAFERLGQGISTSIMLNTRGRLAQAQLARQTALDAQTKLLRDAQIAHQNQVVMDLLAQQARLKKFGNTFAAGLGDPNQQSAGELVGQSPAAIVNYYQGYTLKPGDERRVPTQSAPVVSQQPRDIAPNHVLRPNQAGESGYVGSPSAGVYAPPQGTNAPVQVVPPAPHYGTAQADVEQIRAERAAMGINAVELERLAETDPDQFSYLVEMRKRARQRALAGGQTNNVPMIAQPQTNAPVIRKYNPATGRIE